MSSYNHPDILLQLGKDKIQDYHREADGATLAKEAQNNQPGRIRGTLNWFFTLFRPSALKIEKHFQSRRTPREKPATVRD